MSNFSYLEDKKEFASFANACIAAENIFNKDTGASLIRIRRALELAVEWVYKHDMSLNQSLLYTKESKLYTLLNNSKFKNLIGEQMSAKLYHIRNNGNKSAHESVTISRKNAVQTLKHLFDFVQWIDSRYGQKYTSRSFSELNIPVENTSVPSKSSGSWWKYAGAAVAGGVLTIGAAVAAIMLDGKKN